MDPITLPLVVAGFITAVLTELFKFIPALRATDLRKAGTALAVTLVASLGYAFYTVEVFSVATFFTVLTTAFISYKALIQPVVKKTDSISQE